MTTSRELFADAMGFLNDRMGPQIMDSACKLDLVHMTASPPILPNMTIPGMYDTLSAIERFEGGLAQNTRPIIIGKSKHDMTRIINGEVDGSTTVVLGLQHVPNDVYVPALFNAGIRVMQIAYKEADHFGGGFAAKDASLTDAGMRILISMANCGMILDLSHSGHKTAWDALRYIRKHNLPLPVMISHTGVYDMYNYPRNLTLDHMVNVEMMGGVVGLYTLSFGLHPSNNGERRFIDHLHRMNDTLLDSAICLGTDGIHRTIDQAAQKVQFDKLKAMLDRDGSLRARFPDECLKFNTPHKIETIMDMLQAQEIKIDGIAGRNLIDFFGRSLPS